MPKAIAKLWKGVCNLVDDFALLIVTTVGVLTTSYLPTLRRALIEHPPASELDWPRWYIVAVAAFVALLVTVYDASRGTKEERKAMLGQRIVKCFLMGTGGFALLEKIIGGGG